MSASPSVDPFSPVSRIAPARDERKQDFCGQLGKFKENMPVFNSTEEFYEIFQILFAQIAEADPQVSGAVSSARIIIRLNCSSPSGEITVNGRINPPRVIYGKSSLRPDLEAELACDVLHQILMGTLPLGKALGNGQMKVRGAMLKSFVLADIFHQGQAIYPQLVQEKGLSA